MAQALIFTPLSPLSTRQGRLFSRTFPTPSHHIKRTGVKVKLSLNDIIPALGSVDVDVHAVGERIESLVYTLADAAVVAADPVAGTATDATAQKNGGWFGFISDAMELVLKVNSICL